MVERSSLAVMSPTADVDRMLLTRIRTLLLDRDHTFDSVTVDNIIRNVNEADEWHARNFPTEPRPW